LYASLPPLTAPVPSRRALGSRLGGGSTCATTRGVTRRDAAHLRHSVACPGASRRRDAVCVHRKRLDKHQDPTRAHRHTLRARATARRTRDHVSQRGRDATPTPCGDLAPGPTAKPKATKRGNVSPHIGHRRSCARCAHTAVSRAPHDSRKSRYPCTIVHTPPINMMRCEPSAARKLEQYSMFGDDLSGAGLARTCEDESRV